MQLVKYCRVKIHSERYIEKTFYFEDNNKLTISNPDRLFIHWSLPLEEQTANPSWITPFREVSVLEFYFYFYFLKQKRKSVFSVLFPLALPARRQRGVWLSFHMKKEPWWCGCSSALALMRMRCFVFPECSAPLSQLCCVSIAAWALAGYSSMKIYSSSSQLPSRRALLPHAC